MAEEEVIMEVEAVQSVYEEDCVVLEKYPPHLHVHIKPRTADVSSQQFVEAVIGIRASPQYPDDPPHISILDSKGLDDKRKNHLISSIRDKACELSSYLMLVTLCEEAAEQLSSMNHPDGDCPLCLSPLVDVDGGNDDALPFMKLMSCFHCFHCECIIRWWNWLQMEKALQPSTSSQQNQKRGAEENQENVGTCPVCRKLFHTKDIEHVLDLVGKNSQSVDAIEINAKPQQEEGAHLIMIVELRRYTKDLNLTFLNVQSMNSSEVQVKEDEELLHSDSENIRKQTFEAILKLQKENDGLIEPKKTEVLLPGMFLPRPIETPPPPPPLMAAECANDGIEQLHTTSAHNTKTNSNASSRPSSSLPKRSGTRKHRGQNSRKQGATQWIKKDNDARN